MTRRHSTPRKSLPEKKSGNITQKHNHQAQSPSKRANFDRTSSNTSQNPANLSRRKLRQGTKAVREIRHLQRSTNLLIPKAPFSRIVREIFKKFGHGDKRIQTLALEALQEATEIFITQTFENSALCCYHANRVTLKPSDVHLVRRLRGVSHVGNH